MTSKPVLAQNPGNPGTGDHPSEHLCREMVPDHVPWYSRGEWVETCAYGPRPSSTQGGSTAPWISDFLAGPGLKLLIFAAIIALIIVALQSAVAAGRQQGEAEGISEQLSGSLYLGSLVVALYLGWDGLKWGGEVRWSFGSSLVAAIVGLGGGIGLTFLMYSAVERINRRARS